MNKLNCVKENLIKNLKENLLPFWDKMVDLEYGGFYGEWDEEPLKESDKGTVYLSRLLWSFSVLYQKNNETKYLTYINSIFDFLKSKLYDNVNKGFYWSATYDGKIKNNHKHLYAQSFCLYGLSEYYSITKDKMCLNIIEDLYNIIRENFINFPKNYSEERTESHQKVENKLLEGYDIYPEITTNTLLHLIESTGNCYKVLKDKKFNQLCLTIIDILFKYGYDYDKKSLIQFLNYDLNSVVDVISYGHDIEVSWLLYDILDILDFNEKEKNKYRKILFELGNSALKGIYNNYLLSEKINGMLVNTDIIWWIQAETLIALLNLYEITKSEIYLEQLCKVYDVLKKSIITENEWLWSADENYNPLRYHKQAEMWKANYHNFRCIFKFMEV